MVKVKRALISVSDKTGIEELVKGLAKHGVTLLSTGGTAKAIKAAGVSVTDVAQVTGFPEMMDGRVKTLHPAIHGGLLALRDNPEHMKQLAAHHIEPIDMVVVNLYPFAKTVAKPGVELAEAIENIDIGGPSMIRSASKNFRSVAIVVNPARYGAVLAELEASGGTIGDATLASLAVEAFDHTADYDAGIHRYLQDKLIAGSDPLLPATLRLTLTKLQDLRYGENPHQRAAFYRWPAEAESETLLTSARQLHGKELSFNNILDLQAALDIIREFDEPAACVIKHSNPCGAATAATLAEAYRKAYAADPKSAYGGIVGLNRACTPDVVEQMKDVFYECVLAPGFELKALELLTARKNIRLLDTGPLKTLAPGQAAATGMDFKRISGGFLLQERDRGRVGAQQLKTVTQRQPTDAEIADLLFAWRICKHVKSNAIVVAKDRATLGVGPGQTNRVGSVEIALRTAGDKAKGAVLASDAYFPFPDSIESAARAGITALIQPGGSVRDEEVMAAANSHGLAMVFTGMRHFRH